MRCNQILLSDKGPPFVLRICGRAGAKVYATIRYDKTVTHKITMCSDCRKRQQSQTTWTNLQKFT